MDIHNLAAAAKTRAPGAGMPQNQRRKTVGKMKPPAASIDGRRRFSITLSPKSAEAFVWLKQATDADTDSEVIRNALRLHYVLLQQSIAGDSFFVCAAGDTGRMTKVELFIAK